MNPLGIVRGGHSKVSISNFQQFTLTASALVVNGRAGDPGVLQAVHTALLGGDGLDDRRRTLLQTRVCQGLPRRMHVLICIKSEMDLIG